MVDTLERDPSPLPPGVLRPAPPRRRRPLPRWQRWLLMAVSTFLAVCLLAVGLLYGYVKWRASQLKTAKCPSCVA
ncbi:MAG TPA: hypothetical protein VMU14_09120, partial [Acidimicrobiales bacterium]|nr:hypothetical protein [Acidimicrobiales bacterium]